MQRVKTVISTARDVVKKKQKLTPDCRLCKFCGEPFTPTKPWHVYDKIACRGKDFLARRIAAGVQAVLKAKRAEEGKDE